MLQRLVLAIGLTVLALGLTAPASAQSGTARVRSGRPDSHSPSAAPWIRTVIRLILPPVLSRHDAVPLPILAQHL